jgi:UTP-glucose-1-phosphate uridylyltransferase
MLPIVDKPTIQYIVEEAVKYGIEDHFDKSYELEEKLAEKEKWDMLNELKKFRTLHMFTIFDKKNLWIRACYFLCAKLY